MKSIRTKITLLTSLFCMVILLAFIVMPVFADFEEAGDALIVGVPADRCPIFYPDSNTGEPVGIGVDLMRLAAAEAGYNASFRFIKEANLPEALDNTEYAELLYRSGQGLPSSDMQWNLRADSKGLQDD